MTLPDSAPLASLASLDAALLQRDQYTGLHCDRVVLIALELGGACGLAAGELAPLSMAARFHDIGKIGIPDEVLLKPGSLDKQEWALMTEHAAKGERIYRATLRADAPEVAQIIRHHHEAFDGSGYPDGLQGEQIPLLARILTLADCYDAMASSRVYHAGKAHREIMRILHSEKGRKSDPRLFQAFATMIEHSANRAP